MVLPSLENIAQLRIAVQLRRARSQSIVPHRTTLEQRHLSQLSALAVRPGCRYEHPEIHLNRAARAVRGLSDSRIELVRAQVHRDTSDALNASNRKPERRDSWC
jgi:hypothetical protein